MRNPLRPARPPSRLARLRLALWLAAIVATGCPSSRPPPPAPAPPSRPPASAEERAATHANAAAEGEDRAGTLYVPAYSSFPTAERGRILLGIVLSVRNVDPDEALTLRFVDYYDTPGHRMRRYLEGPRRIGPLGTEEFSVPVADDFGGSGANFLVGWSAVADAHPPLAEAVMVGHAGTGYLSFTSRGIEIESHAEDGSEGDATSPEAAHPPDAAPTRDARSGAEIVDPWREPPRDEERSP